MTHTLFRQLVVSQPARTATARGYAMPLSVAAHGTLIAALAAVSLLRSVALPEPRTALPDLRLPVILPPSPSPPPVVAMRPRPARAAVTVVRETPWQEPASTAEAEAPVDFAEPGTALGPDAPAQGCSGCLVGDVAQSGVAGGDPTLTGPPAGPLRVGSGVEAPRKLRHVAPVYPDTARQARVQGTVTLECTIDPQGRVAQMRVVSAPPLLETAALDAVRQWVYTPTRLNGVPVAVLMTVTVHFGLK
jgi:protein TonB